MKKMFKKLGIWAAHIKSDALTLWFACRHPMTPWYVKLLCLFVVGYAFSPIDLIPDFVPVLGYVDDLLLLPVFIRLAVKLLPPDILQDSRKKVIDWRKSRGTKPRSYLAASLIVIIWVVLIYWFFCWMVSLLQGYKLGR